MSSGNEFTDFDTVMRKILAVSHEEFQIGGRVNYIIARAFDRTFA
jgi:hypothetical protein